MELTETDDLSIVTEVLHECGLWADSEVPDLFATRWLVAKSGTETAGCFMVARLSPYEIRSHICILPKFRGVGSSHAVDQFIKWFAVDSDERINKLTVEIPESDEPCIRLAVFMGFSEEGYNRESVMNNSGQFEGQRMLGMTREEALKCHQR